MRKRMFVLLGLLMAASPLSAVAAPQPPCTTVHPLPAFAAPGMPPVIAQYQSEDLANWNAPACIKWNGTDGTKLIIALAGSFRSTATLDRLLARIGAISTLAHVRYWSTTEGEWRPLAYQASALRSANPKDHRPDFTSQEMKAGAQLYYSLDDSRTGEGVTRMTVREHGHTSAIIATENVTPVRRFMITAVPAGALQTMLFLQRIAPDVWGVYLLSRTSNGISMLAAGHEASYINRAVALFRQIAGIPTDQEPPAVR